MKNIKQEVLQEIKEIQKRMTVLEEIINKPELEWSPKGGEWFFGASGVGESKSTSVCKEFGIEFETGQEAEEAYITFRNYHRLYKLQQELDDGWKLEPNSTKQTYYILTNVETGKSTVGSSQKNRAAAGIAFKSVKTVQRAIDLIEAGQVFVGDES